MSRRDVPGEFLAPLPTRVGPRVRLAFPERDDQAEFLRLLRASRAFYRGRGSPPATAEHFERYVARCRSANFVGFLIRRRADGAILGTVELSQIVRGPLQSANLGYRIFAPYARQGYMTEAVSLVLHYAFRQLRLHRLEAGVQPSNAPSLALIRRLGFTREGYSRRLVKIAGRWRDHERWAILVEDWRTRKRSRPGERS